MILSLISNKIFFLASGSNYRNLLIEMLLNIRIKAPIEYRNITIGEKFASMNWKDRRLGQSVQDLLYFGTHNHVCLAHGRVPILPVNNIVIIVCDKMCL